MMRTSIAAAIVIGCALPASAQFKNGSQSVVLELPTISPRAAVTQRIGLTDITVVYYRPKAEGRRIFGGLVGYGRVWRAGANHNTTIEFHDPVTVDGHPLAPGTYGVHMIPAADTWTVIFSTNSTSWGSFSYDQREDALRIQVKPLAIDLYDELAYEFGQVTGQSAVLSLKWERTAIPMTLAVDVHKKTLESIHQQLRNLPGFTAEAWADAAMYCLDEGINYEEALTWVDRSIEQDARFQYMSTKVRLLEAMGRRSDAAALFEKAMPLASAPELYVYADGLMKQKRREEAIALFLANAQRNPTSWIAIAGRGRAESARGDRAAARKSLTDALSKAPGEGQKILVERLLTRLDAGEDIG